MDLLINDLSLHGQFSDIASFRESMQRVMQARTIARRFGRELYCHRSLCDAQITKIACMRQAVGGLRSRDERRSIMTWLSRTGPFWEDERRHGEDEWYEYNDEVVTDSALGEVAHSVRQGEARSLVSFSPSKYVKNPLSVRFVRDTENAEQIDLANYWQPQSLEEQLAAAPPPLMSWKALGEHSLRRFTELIFAEDAFSPLRRQPFKQAVAQHFVVLFAVLHKLRTCGNRSSEGKEIISKHFSGKKAWFTDSSTTEKSRYRQELTFKHPEDADKRLFCPWHGKIKTPQYRVHFSWPLGGDEPLYVVYVGPKITKK